MNWKSVYKELPPLGAFIEINASHYPRDLCPCSTNACIFGVAELPELGRSWRFGEHMYVVEWRYVQ